MKCPICRKTDETTQHEIYCDTFDNSLLYNTVRLSSCNMCGHVFNALTPDEEERLKEYYIGEYIDCNSNSTVERMDGARARQLKSFLGDLEDVAVFDQKLEHFVDPSVIFEMKRRYVCIGVPDAARYSMFSFFRPYWLIMREHIHHFDFPHLAMFSRINNYEVIKIEQNSMPIMSEKMQMPILTVLLRSPARSKLPALDKTNFYLRDTIKEYALYADKRMRRIVSTLNEDAPICFWGIGREFFYINPFFSEFSNKILVDNNLHKQTQTVNSVCINDESILHMLDKDFSIVITAMAHREKLHKKLVMEIGFKGEIIEL